MEHASGPAPERRRSPSRSEHPTLANGFVQLWILRLGAPMILLEYPCLKYGKSFWDDGENRYNGDDLFSFCSQSLSCRFGLPSALEQQKCKVFAHLPTGLCSSATNS